MRIAPLAMLTFAATPATAQALDVDLSVEATNDVRARGLSDSAGKAALDATAGLNITPALRVQASATTLRDSRRHAGSELGIDLVARYTAAAGPITLSAGATGHGFLNRSSQNYVELDGRASYLLGPATLALGSSYAPRQGAIGGDNLYLDATVDVGIPGTPLTVYGGAGHSSGAARDIRATRLRPDGRYWDYHLGAEYVNGACAAGLRLTDTSIGAASAGPYTDRHLGRRLGVYVRLNL